MKRWIPSMFGLIVGALLLGGCATPTPTRLAQFATLEAYATARTTLPKAPEHGIRLYIYRPQALVGMWGSAIVIVNGKWMGNAANPIEDNRLLPGAVFVVDVPAESAKVWWHTRDRGEVTDKALEISASPSGTRYLRWSMKPTYGYLEPVEADRAISEIESLRFSGYVSPASF